MAIIKKKLENLKPGKDYLLTVRAKNIDLNITSDYADSVLFTVPQDGTVPNDLGPLELFSSLQTVMFVFNFSTDKDISRYEYELYAAEDIELVGGSYAVKSGSTYISQGFSSANVFTVAVDNLQVMTSSATEGLIQFFGRVRAIDTSNNAGNWTDIVKTDEQTPLIDNQYIGSLTASKITAGTIGAHTIQLNGVNSILKSSNFNGIASSTPGIYDNATTGWLINGLGNAYLANASIRGAVNATDFNLYDDSATPNIIASLGPSQSFLNATSLTTDADFDHSLVFKNRDARIVLEPSIVWTQDSSFSYTITNIQINTPSVGLMTITTSENVIYDDVIPGIGIYGVTPNYFNVDPIAVYDVTGSTTIVAYMPSGTSSSYISGGIVNNFFNPELTISGPTGGNFSNITPASLSLLSDSSSGSRYTIQNGIYGTLGDDALSGNISGYTNTTASGISIQNYFSGSSDNTLTSINTTSTTTLSEITMQTSATLSSTEYSSQVVLSSGTLDVIGNSSMISLSIANLAKVQVWNSGQIGIGPGTDGIAPWTSGTRGNALFQQASLQVVENDSRSSATLSLRHTQRSTTNLNRFGLDLTVDRTSGIAYVTQKENADLILRTTGPSPSYTSYNGIIINSSGAAFAPYRMLVGTTTDDSSQSLTVYGKAAIVYGGVKVIYAGPDTSKSDTSTFLYSDAVYNNTTASGSSVVVDSNGRLRRFTSSSRYKENIESWTTSLNDVLQLRPVSFTGKNDDPDTKIIGLIAEEVEIINPGVVQYSPDGEVEGINYNGIIDMLINAVKELAIQINEIKSKIN
jgi:hypothetical protein